MTGVGDASGTALEGGTDVRMEQGAAYHRRHLVDGGHALSAAIVRLSLRNRSGVEAIRNVQGDGTPAAQGNHQSRDDRDVGRRTLSRMERALVFVWLAVRKACARNHLVGCPRSFFP